MTRSCCLRTGSSGHPPSTPPRQSSRSSSTPRPRSRRSHGIPLRTRSPPIPSSPAGSSTPSSSRSPTSSSSVAARLVYSPSTRPGKRPRSGSHSARASLRRWVSRLPSLSPARVLLFRNCPPVRIPWLYVHPTGSPRLRWGKRRPNGFRRTSYAADVGRFTASPPGRGFPAVLPMTILSFPSQRGPCHGAFR